MSAPLSGELAQIGKSVVIKGELSGSEDLVIDGRVELTFLAENHTQIVVGRRVVRLELERLLELRRRLLEPTLLSEETS